VQASQPGQWPQQQSAAFPASASASQPAQWLPQPAPPPLPAQEWQPVSAPLQVSTAPVETVAYGTAGTGACLDGPAASVVPADRPPDGPPPPPPERLTIYLDEVPMSWRPRAPPAATDREVFVDPLPGDDGSPELEEWVRNFGEVAEVHRLPDQDRGYLLFKEPAAAARCVAARAGAWSESERAISGHRTLERKRGVHTAYPDCLVHHFIGDRGGALSEIARRVGLRHLHVFSASAPHTTDTGPSRAHFVGWGSSWQLDSLREELQMRLEEVHRYVTQLFDVADLRTIYVEGVPESCSDERLHALFTEHGKVQGVQRTDPRRGRPSQEHAVVTFASGLEARTAAWQLDGTALTGSTLRCTLRCPWNSLDLLPQGPPEPARTLPPSVPPAAPDRSAETFGASSPSTGALDACTGSPGVGRGASGRGAERAGDWMAEDKRDEALEPTAAMDLEREAAVAKFIRDNGIDERAADRFRRCTLDVQRKILERGELTNARNPSSALIARIKAAESGDDEASRDRGGRDNSGRDNSRWEDQPKEDHRNGQEREPPRSRSPVAGRADGAGPRDGGDARQPPPGRAPPTPPPPPRPPSPPRHRGDREHSGDKRQRPREASEEPAEKGQRRRYGGRWQESWDEGWRQDRRWQQDDSWHRGWKDRGERSW